MPEDIGGDTRKMCESIDKKTINLHIHVGRVVGIRTSSKLKRRSERIMMMMEIPTKWGIIITALYRCGVCSAVGAGFAQPFQK